MNRRGGFVVVVASAVLTAVVLVALDPIPQDPDYHGFADGRTLWGIPNALNVLSNLLFVPIGLLGMRRARGTADPASVRWFFAAVACVALGSAVYHLDPTNLSLVGDRLPMALAFTALLSAVVADRIDRKLGRRLRRPLLLLGAGSVLYWGLSEWFGAGDLRPYLWVQFFPMLALPLIAILFRRGAIRGRTLLAMVAWYAAAKVAEGLDAQIWELGLGISGHTLKHLLAAMAPGALAIGLSRGER